MWYGNEENRREDLSSRRSDEYPHGAAATWYGNEEKRREDLSARRSDGYPHGPAATWYADHIKKPAALLLALILVFCLHGISFAAEIVPDGEIEDSRYVYKTAEIAYGDIEVTHEFHFTEFVWKYREIRWHGGDRVCSECHTKYRKEIKAGDPVITLVSDTPEIDIEETERALQRRKEAYEQKKLDYTDERNAQLKQMNEARDAASHDLLSLRIQRQEVEFEKYCFEEERAIAEEEEKIQALRSETVLTAPVSGTVSYVTDAKDGRTVIHDGDVIARIRYAEKLVVAVSQQDDNMPARVHYGNEARFVTKKDGEILGTVSGRVIASNYIQEMSSAKQDKGWAMVVLDLTDPQEIKEILGSEKPINTWTDMYYIERDLKNVPVLPRSALMRDDGGDYVFLYRDGDRINKRYVTVGEFRTDDECELISGLREGDFAVTMERSW